MSKPLPMMNEVELGQCEFTADEAGFGGIETERGMLPLKAMKVDTEILGLTARTTLRQTFRNAYDTRLEATYIFPLPARAAVRHFRMVVDGRVVEGEIEERGKARETYERAIASGQRASIVEQERPDVFTIRVGNLAPGEEAEIEFEMVGPLVFADGEATWRFPLVVAPRYVPGTPLGDDVGTGVAPDTDRVPDASRISPPTMIPGFPNPVALEMRVSVDGAGLPITDLRGSLPGNIKAEGARCVIEVNPGQRLNQDCIVRFRTTADKVASALTFSPDESGDEGTFELTVMPPQPALEARKPRDVVFVLDRSGSMGGWKMVAARRAMARMVDTLTPTDRFTVIAFDTVNEVPSDHGTRLVQGSNRNRWKAMEFLAGVDARGGTNLDFAIEEAVKRVGTGYQDRERQIILVTDGQVSQEAAVLEHVQNDAKGIRFFTVGIDRSVNASLLQRMAEYGGGHCELIESEQRLDATMDKMHRRMEAVVVEEMAWTFEGLEVDQSSVAPARPPALFAGAPVVIRGRAKRNSGALKVALSGIAEARAWKAEVEGTERSEPALAAMWARHRLINLEDRYDATGEHGLVKQITELSLRHKVLCRFTAFVAVDREGGDVDTSADLRQVTQLVEEPEGWAAAGMPMAQAAPPAMSAPAPAPRGGFGGAPGGAAPKGASGSRARKARREESKKSERYDTGAFDDEVLYESSFDSLAQEEGASLELQGDAMANEKSKEMAPVLGRLISDVGKPADATDFDVLVAVLVYLVSGAWTLEHSGLDNDRAAAVLGKDVLTRLRGDLHATLQSLVDASAMVPDGPLSGFAANYSLGEAAAIVSNLSVGSATDIAQANFEALELRGGKVTIAKRSRLAFWK